MHTPSLELYSFDATLDGIGLDHMYFDCSCDVETRQISRPKSRSGSTSVQAGRSLE